MIIPATDTRECDRSEIIDTIQQFSDRFDLEKPTIYLLITSGENLYSIYGNPVIGVLEIDFKVIDRNNTNCLIPLQSSNVDYEDLHLDPGYRFGRILPCDITRTLKVSSNVANEIWDDNV